MVATLLILISVLNVGLFSGVVHAQTFEVALDDFRDETPEDLQEFGLVNVMVEQALLENRTLSNDVQSYCERVQEALGAVCMITPWNGETSSRIVEALQQMYFEGVEVQGGIASLVGLVLVGEVPLPVVNNGIESFPSMFPYTDLVRPAYVYDPQQELFVRSQVDSPQAEVWHGLIRPSGTDDERIEALKRFFQKNAQFYAGDEEYTLVKDEIGFHDHFWENDSFDNETKKWYLEKMDQLDRLFNYRYSGEWLSELSGEAVDRLAQLTSRTFEDAPVDVQKTDRNAVNADIGFDPVAAERSSNQLAGQTISGNEDVEPYGADRLSETVPDVYSPGPIRNFLKDYVNVVARYVQGATELMDRAGRRQSSETLSALLTKLDKYYGTIVYLVTQEFEQYLYDQADEMALDFELIQEYEEQNEFYTEEATDVIADVKAQLSGQGLGPLGIESKAKSGPLGYGSKIYTRYVNGIEVAQVENAEHCSLERGSNFVAEDGEIGKAVSFNRKDDPLTSQDISGVSGRKAEDEIKQIYKSFGYCSYMVKDRCVPAASKRPLFDFASSELYEGDNDFRTCFDADGPPAPKDTETSVFHDIPSIINHVQPTGGLINAVLTKQLAHYLPIDAIRHASFYLGGGSQYSDANVGRLRYPNFFELKSAGEQQVEQEVTQMVSEKEKDLRRLRVEANWKRFAQYIAYSLPVQGRPDFWNYNEIDGFEQRFLQYRNDVLGVLRRELDPLELMEDYELIEAYLTGNQISDEVEQEIADLLVAHFPNALAKQDLDLKCDYSYEIPPVDVKIEPPKIDQDNLFTADFFLEQLIVPDFNPPSISRECDNKIAKSTQDEVHSLREFYFSRGGVEVDMTILHDADRFVEVINPVNVLLYFTPVPPPLPPNTNMLAAIKLFDEQVKDLEDGSQPVTRLSKVVEPVPLQPPGELNTLLTQYKDLLVEATHWLNLSIEAKHKEGISRLTDEKEMVYLVMDGDGNSVDFALPSLQGSFEDDEDAGIASSADVLDQIRDRERALKEQQEEAQKKRALQRRVEGEKSSECGDSVPLIEWPGAVSCWLDEIVAGPLIEAPVSEDDDEVSGAPSSSLQGAPGQIALSENVLTLKDRAEATVNLPLEVEVSWEGQGAVRVEPAREGKAIVIPERLGEGVVLAKFNTGTSQQVERMPVRVTGQQAFLRQVTTGELAIDSDDQLEFAVEVRDPDGELLNTSAVLNIYPDEPEVFAVPQTVQITEGKGSFIARPGRKAKQSGLSVGSDTIARSQVVSVNTLAGPPAELRWDFGDGVVGLDGEIAGELTIYDRRGNPARGQGLRFGLQWSDGLTVNGKTGGEASFFAVAGRAGLKVTVDPERLQELALQAQASDDAYGLNNDQAVSTEGFLQVVSVDGADTITLPDPVRLDLSQDYRIQVDGLPEEVTVGSRIPLELRVEDDREVLVLKNTTIDVQSEFAGEVEVLPVDMNAATGRVDLFAGASAGVQRIVIDDPNFGSFTHEITVLGQDAAGLRLLEASYKPGEVRFEVAGKDALGNQASLKDMIGKIRLIGDGAEVLEEKSVALEAATWVQDLEVQQQPDRIRLELSVEGLESTIQQVLPLEQVLTAEDLQQLSWNTPYMVLAGSSFGDYRIAGSVGQSILFGGFSKVQALTTEITPHYGMQQAARIWPSGRVELGPEMKVEAIWENLKPVLVFSDHQNEVGRLALNMRNLPLEVVSATDQLFTWTRSQGLGKVLLVPDQAVFESSGRSSGVLVSQQGEKLISIDQMQVTVHDAAIQTEVFSDSGDVLVLSFMRSGRDLARMYVHVNADQVLVNDIAPLQWTFSGNASDDYQTEKFYAGESTAEETGLVIKQKGTSVRYSLGEGRPALDDVREVNGEGFEGRDKMVLSFLAGNTVGESTLLQSEGIVNLGDPVMSLRLAKHELDNGESVSAVETSELAARTDYSVGQMVYAPENGEVTQLLRLDVEGDNEDDLLVVLEQGGDSKVHYLEGQGEGARWGDVTELLDLGQGVKDVQAVQKRSLAVLYNSGQLVLEQNIQGRFTSQMVDFSVLKKPDLRINSIQVRDFDADNRDDLLFMTGDRELWIWYGSQSLSGIQFGVSPDDRQLLKVMSVRLQDEENLKTAAWLYTNNTPSYIPNCREARFECQAKYFRGFEGVSTDEPEEEVDRLEQLLQQAASTELKDQDEVFGEQSFLVRLDQLDQYKDAISIDIPELKEGAQLNLKQQFEMVVTISPRRTDDPFVMRFDLGADFTVVGRVNCEGCNDDLQLGKTPGTMWTLEGKMTSARPVTVRFTLEYAALPPFTYQVMQTNDDPYLDVGINVEDNASGQITVFESRDQRDYVETIFGDAPASAASSGSAANELSDLMRGIGIEGVSTDQLKQKLLNQQSEIEASTADLFQNLHEDNNADGYPDVYQENTSLFPEAPVSSQDDKTASRGVGTRGDVVGKVKDFVKSLIPRASAQAQNADTFNAFPSSSFSNLDNLALMFDNIEQDVQMIVKALKCSRGCLPLPMNFAFLAPGPINIFGTPAGFDPGVPIFGVSPVPFFVWPPLVPYQVTQFRIYLSPTLTLGLGVGICLGQYLLGQCFVFSVPIGSLLGSESVCDAVKQGLGGLMQGIQATVGQVSEGLSNAVNSTGVIKAKVNSNPTSDIESVLGVSLGGSTHNRGVNPSESKVFLNPIPSVFVDWWDRQWEEVVNSLTDLPDITVRLPDFGSSIDRDYFDKLSEKVSGDTLLNLQELYDLINSLPAIRLQADVIQLQIPWIEPGILTKIEQSLYQFLYTFMLEFIAFMRSFNLPCNITVVRQDLFTKIRQRAEQRGVSEETDQEIARLQAQLEQENANIQQAEQELNQFSEAQGFAQETVAERREYFNELNVRHEKVDTLSKRYDQLEAEINRLDQPQRITEILPVFMDVMGETLDFWGEQAEGMTSASVADGIKRESAVALRSCIAQNLALDMAVDVQPFIDSIQKNIDALERWQEFPRELAKYLNALEFYIEEVVQLIDQLTSIVLKWWSEFEKKLDLWIDVIFAYQELIALINLIIDILKGYNKKCGLCTSDRLTLKELILKLVFGVVPKFPVIDFPNWPDVRLDFSDVQLGIDVTLPVFEVKTVDLRWPELPDITFPRFNDLAVDLNLNAGFSVKLPEVPLVIPEPPNLPPLQPIPDLPQINLPNLPPAPEVPQVLESLLPIMKIIQTILDIWCLINKSLIPIDEKQLKTQIENLTNRSLNLILPIDVLLTFDLLPGDLLTNLVPFDLIDVTSHFRAQVDVDPLPNLEETIEQQFHAPVNTLTQQVDLWINALRNSLQQGTGAASGALQNTLNQFNVGSINLNAGVQGGVDLGTGAAGIESDFPELLNYEPVPKPNLPSELMELKKQNLVSYNEGFRSSLEDVRDAVHDLNRQQPEEILQQLASLDSGNVLVAGEPSWVPYEVSKEKREALLDPQNFVEKQFSLLDKPRLIAQGEQAGNALENIQNELLGSDGVGVDDLGVAVVRDGQVGRLQDYPLDDPVVNVWDNDVFLAYENAVYLKSDDNSERRHQPYQGRVLRGDIQRFQRTKVHQLAAKSASSSQAGGGKATIDWTWDAPGVEDVELTIWDSVGGAQRLDQNHIRFYLDQPSEDQGVFRSITFGVNLTEGQTFVANREVKLRFGQDLVTIPRGVIFTIPSLILRSIIFEGEGTVQLENLSGQGWDFDLGSDVDVEVSGLVEMDIPADQVVHVPQVDQRPFIRRIAGDAEGALKTRVEVLSGESVPEGTFMALRETILRELDSDMTLTLNQGMVFEVEAKDDWEVATGRGEVAVSDDLEFTQAKVGTVLLDDELVRGEFTVREGDNNIDILPEQQVVWSSISGPSFEVTLPAGNYYGRIREREGSRGYSPIIHAAAQPVFATAQIVPGTQHVQVPIYSPVEVDARDFVIADLPDDSYHWRLSDQAELSSGHLYRHPGFDSVGEQKLELFVQDGEHDVQAKTFVLDVFIPDLTIDPALYEEARVIRVQSDPPLPNIPIGIVGSRDGVEDWLLAPTVDGTRLGNRYFTDERGVVQLQPLDALEGINIIIEGSRNVARLYPNGRVVIRDEFKELCQNETLHDVDGYMKFRVSCVVDGALENKFEVRMVPHIDTDVTIVDEFDEFNTGVVIRSMQEAIDVIPLPRDAQFAPGGAQVRVSNGNVLMVITSEGQVELAQDNLALFQKPFEDPAEPVVWQLVQNDAVLSEFQILGPGDNVSLIDPVDRDEVQGDADADGMLDVWEQTYGVDDPAADVDTDGLTNLQEFQAGTDPTKRDTDGDGLSDGEEVNPLSASSSERSVNFSDVTEESPYYDAITELARFGFIQGYGDGSFKPDQPVTRAEAIKILMSVIRCENCEFPTQQTKDELDPRGKDVNYFVQFHDGVFDGSSEDPLKNFAFDKDFVEQLDGDIRTYLDVSVSDWYYYCVEIATQLGLIHGYRGFENGQNALGSFIPDRDVNIAELMKMVIEAVGDTGKSSPKVYAPADGWWNDPQNNYLAKAEEDLELLLDAADYQDPLRSATRAEVAYAAYRVLRENGVLDFDNDGIANQSDDCPCQPGQRDPTGIINGCPVDIEGRTSERLFEGIEITQFCPCLILVDADLFTGSSFSAVITGKQDEDVLEQSNSVP